MFQFTPFPSMAYVLGHGCIPIAVCGFPHSDICGSMDMCSSPQLFAAYHVLLRLPVPRHPPDALVNLTLPVYALYTGLHSLLSVSEFSGFSTSRLDESLPTIFIAYLDSLSICFSLGLLFNFQGTFLLYKKGWWRIQGSNLRPPACKAGALPAELIPHKTHSAETESP